MLSKTITLDHLRHRGIQNIRIDFKFDSALNELAKSLPARWSFSNKCWYLENTQENVQKIFTVFKNKAWVDITRLKARQELFPKTVLQKTKEAQKNTAKVSEETILRIHEFEKYLKSIRYSERTVENYIQSLSSFFGFHSPKRPEEITHADIEKFNFEHILKNQYSVSYQRQVVSVLKLFYQRIADRKIDLQKLERPPKSRMLPVVLSEQEMIAMLKCIPNVKHKAIVMLLYSSGLRISELLNLKIADIDMNRMQIRVVQGKGNKDRYVGLSEVFLIVLKRYAEAYKPTDYVFNGEGGGKYSAESTRAIIRNASRKAGIKKKVTPHILRHSYATHLLENGVDLRYIQELLGHKSSETTEIYTHVAQKKLINIKSPLDIIVKNEMNKQTQIDEGDKQQQQLRISPQK